jgi:hypothetical protein
MSENVRIAATVSDRRIKDFEMSENVRIADQV